MKNISINLLKKSRIEKKSKSDSIESFNEIDFFIHISRWLSHLEHKREIRLNHKIINSIWIKKRTKRKNNLHFHTIFTLIIFTVACLLEELRNDTIFFFFFIDFRSFALAIWNRSLFDFLIFFARKIVDVLFFSFFFVFSFIAISLFASILIFVTLTKSEISSWLNRWSFLFSSFISSTKRNQSRCVR